MTLRDDLITRLTNAASELAASEDGDTNEHVMRRWDEFDRALKILERLDAVTDSPAGPYEIITRGET